MAKRTAIAVAAAASNPTLLYVAVTAWRACHGAGPAPSAAAAAAKPHLRSERASESVPRQRGDLSTCASFPDHGLDLPSAEPGARSNGQSQDTFVARAVASSR